MPIFDIVFRRPSSSAPTYARMASASSAPSGPATMSATDSEAR